MPAIAVPRVPGRRLPWCGGAAAAAFGVADVWIHSHRFRAGEDEDRPLQREQDVHWLMSYHLVRVGMPGREMAALLGDDGEARDEGEPSHLYVWGLRPGLSLTIRCQDARVDEIHVGREAGYDPRYDE